MKCILLWIAILALQAYASPLTIGQEKKLKEYSEACSSETGIEVNYVKELMRETKVIGDDPKMKDYMVCFYKKLGILNAEGEIQTDKVKAGLAKDTRNPTKTNEVFGKCAKQKGTPHETAVDLYHCIKAEGVDLY